jgi:uncharacterized protein YegL
MKNNEFLEQIAFGTDDFADNPSPRCPCMLLLDTSGSMGGLPISELNAGLIDFKNDLISDSLAMKQVEVSIISFGPVNIENNFITAQEFFPPQLTANGDTPMGTAIKKGIELVNERKKLYKENGISFYRPWIFLITDGAPTDDWQLAAKLVHEGENSKSFAFFAVGVEGANMDILKQISVRDPLKLNNLKFRELFQWLSNSMKSVSQSTPGTTVPISSPQGWAEV